MDDQTNINSFQTSIGPILLTIIVIAVGMAVGTAVGIWVANRVV